MNRLGRLTGMLVLLQGAGGSGRRLTAGQIAEHFAVSRRTVIRDIDALVAAGVPIVSHNGSRGGYYLTPDHHLAPLPLTFREALLLLFALSGLEKLTDAPFADARASLPDKVRGLLPLQQREAAAAFLEKLSFDIPDRSTHRSPFLDTLLLASRQQQWVRTLYRGTSGNATYTILPLRLYSHSGFWYCDAFSQERGARRTFRVDRFEEVSAAPAPVNVAAPTAEELPYDHPSHPEVVVRLTPQGVLDAEREPHLGHTVLRDVEGSGCMRFRCPPTEWEWFARYFLRLGTDAEVIAPPELRSRIVDKARNILRHYNEP